MLVLSRYRDESIYIGDDVIITVVDIRGDRVRIGVQAPPHVAVHRQEVYEAIKNEQAGGSTRKENSTKSAPLGQELNKRKVKLATEAKGLPISVEPAMGLGELADIIPQ